MSVGLSTVGFEIVGNLDVAASAPDFFNEASQDSVFDPVFLYEVYPADGVVSQDPYVLPTVGLFSVGIMSTPAASSGTTAIFLSDADWTERQRDVPDLDLDFSLGWPSELTFVNESPGWYFNSSRQLVQASVNEPRLAYDRLSGNFLGYYAEGYSKQFIRYSHTSTAATGTPGTLPTNWSENALSGITRTIVAKGTENGMPFIDIRFAGTAGASGTEEILFETSTGIVVGSAQTCATSVYALLASGSIANINSIKIKLYERTSGGVEVTNSLSSDFKSDLSTTIVKRLEYVHTLTGGGTVARANHGVALNITSGAVVDITLRLYIPQFEDRQVVTSPMITTGSSYERYADRAYAVASASWWNFTGGNTVYCEATIDKAFITGQVFYHLGPDGGDSTYGNYTWAYHADQVYAISSGDGGDNIVAPISPTVELNSLYRVVARFEQGQYYAQTTGEAPETDTGSTVPTVEYLSVGCIDGHTVYDNGCLFGYVKRLSIWKRGQPDVNLDSIVNSDMFPPDWAAPNSERANVHYEGRCEPPSLDRSIPLTPESGSRSVLSVGDIRASNVDQYFDDLVNSFAVDGREVVIKLLRNRSDQWEDALEVFRGVGFNWLAQLNDLSIRLRERSYGLDVPLLDLFAGGGDGDGTADNAGRPIPQCYGLCRNITAELVDPTRLIYRFHDRLAESVDAVYDRGNPLAAGDTYASYSDLKAATTAAGEYDVALSASGSYFRLGSSPDGSVTADVQGDAYGGYVQDTASIVKRIMQRATDDENLDQSSFTNMTDVLPGIIGAYFTEQQSASDAVNFICQGTFTFWGDTGAGKLGIDRLSTPSENSGTELNEYVITGEVEPLDLPETIGPTVWRRTIGYRKNWTPLVGNDIVPAPTILESRRDELSKPYKRVSVGLTVRQQKNLLAVDGPLLESLFDDVADATTLCNNLLSLYAPGRQLLVVPVGPAGYSLRLNRTILLTWPRFGLANGKKCRIVGLTYQGAMVKATVFG